MTFPTSPRRVIKFRLRQGKEIVGYEWWWYGNVEQGPKWLYSTDNIHWSTEFIPHTDKDQFIGLPDKDGKEIYGGDIIENAKGVRLEIYWDEGACAFGQRTKDDRLSLAYNWKKVIGNICQNPELLEEENDEC